MIRLSCVAGGLLVFVDVMKELPMNLLLRPLIFETLATYVYQFAKDELLEEAALPALGDRFVWYYPGGPNERGAQQTSIKISKQRKGGYKHVQHSRLCLENATHNPDNGFRNGQFPCKN